MTRLRPAALAIALFAAAACGGTRAGEYANDTAAAPATHTDTSSVGGRPDSTAGISQRTGRPGVAGDSSQNRTRSDVPTKRP